MTHFSLRNPVDTLFCYMFQ